MKLLIAIIGVNLMLFGMAKAQSTGCHPGSVKKAPSLYESNKKPVSAPACSKEFDFNGRKSFAYGPYNAAFLWAWRGNADSAV